MSCPPGTYLTGYNPDGSPICEEITGLARPATLGRPSPIGRPESGTPTIPVVAGPFPTAPTVARNIRPRSNGGGPEGPTPPSEPTFPIVPGVPGIPSVGIPGTNIALSAFFQLLQNVNTTVNNSIDVGSLVQDAITNAISASADNIANTLSGVTTSILGGLSSFVGQLGTFVNSAFSGLGDTLSNAVAGIGNVLADVVKGLVGGLKDAIEALGSVIGDIAVAIRSSVSDLIAAIRENGVSAIIPVLQLIATQIGNVRGIIAALHTDIALGVQSILLLPTQIHDSLASIEATFKRALQELGIKTMPKIDTGVVFDDLPLPAQFLQSIHAFVSDPGLLPSIGSLFPNLSSSVIGCFDPTIMASISRIKQDAANAPIWMKWIWWGLMDVFIASATVISYGKKLIEEGDRVVNKLCPVKELDPFDAVQANLRGLFSGGEYHDELLAQGYSTHRADILRALATNRLQVDVILDGLFRGNISDNSATDQLHALGYTDDQVSILKANAHLIPNLEDILRWKDYGVIDESTARGLMSVLRLEPAFQDRVLQSYQAQETVNDEILTNGRKEASGLGFLADTFGGETPSEVLSAATRERLTSGNVRLKWMEHWNLPSYLTIIQSYFRNFRTLDSVQNIMRCESIPPEFWDELIKLQRPLIPFRSLPGFLAAGIMSEADVVLELSAHGFDPLHIEWILKYAAKSKKTPASPAATALANLSLQTAKTLFEDGVITQDQYKSILEAHKLTPELADLQIQAELLSLHAKQRKVQIETFVEEVLVGQITIDDALAQLHQQGFTQAEILSFQTKVRKQQASSVKHPSIAELRIFIKAQLISLTQFKNELQLQGWRDPWLTAWVALETPPPTP